ncbi:nicotinate-nucleotide pyrophosphorylase [carboxylating]-like isoform X2 [Ornithodoros turicata]|uniref:nicotinate-nucleotide pyrophosphorylase [carboxylating]-like isoform X2 n=1 Tax=Ornithodoros turicata TaxID=34597 RepID=UPI003138D6D6
MYKDIPTLPGLSYFCIADSSRKRKSGRLDGGGTVSSTNKLPGAPTSQNVSQLLKQTTTSGVLENPSVSEADDKVPMTESLLNPVILEELARTWLKEDHPSMDVGSMVVGDVDVTADLWCKSPGVLAGVPFANTVFSLLECEVKWLRNEGEWLHPVVKVAEVTGQARRVLLAERVVLNTLARASGVASSARRMREILNEIHWDGVLAGTRKTTPGFRLVEKYALLVGGADTHRYDMTSLIMLKDNHLAATGSVEKAVRISKKMGGFTKKVEVECSSVEEAQMAARAGCDVIMLDNFQPKDLAATSHKLKTEFPNVLIEASGGITASNLTEYAIADVDIVSSSCLVQGYGTVDLSLKVQLPKKGEEC